MNLYLPTFSLVSISWVGFWIDPANVAGRMSLLITLFLVTSWKNLFTDLANGQARFFALQVIMNVSNTVLLSSHTSSVLTLMDIWLLACKVGMIHDHLSRVWLRKI